VHTSADFSARGYREDRRSATDYERALARALPNGHPVRGMADVRETLIARWLAAGDAGDLDAFDDLLVPDAVIHAPRGLSTVSREAEKAVWREALAAMPDLRHNVQEVLVGRDIEMARVVVTGTMVATFGGVTGTGRSFQMDQAVIAHLRDGRIGEAWEIADVAALERQMTDGG
jgi:predicted ester cyclase